MCKCHTLEIESGTYTKLCPECREMLELGRAVMGMKPGSHLGHIDLSCYWKKNELPWYFRTEDDANDYGGNTPLEAIKARK